MQFFPYDRQRTCNYAKKWALSRNPLFYDFTGIGGDCANFASQCIFAGCCTMNFTETFGWYYVSLNERAPAWSGVDYLYNFLTTNNGTGPFGVDFDMSKLRLGDIIQLSDGEKYYHTLIITGFDRRGYLVNAHSDDSYNRSLSSYNYNTCRGIHICANRVQNKICSCFEPLYNGTKLITCR